MAQAVKLNKKETVDALLKHTGSDYSIGLNFLAFDDGEAEQYMSALEESGVIKKESREERRKKLRAQNKRAVEVAYGNYRKKTISMTWKRFRDFILFALAVAFVTALFGLLVYNEAQIASMNFANNSKERQINKMRQETSQLKETLFVNADLEVVKKTALMHLGMVEPNDKQIVNVAVPQKDHMTTSRSYNSVGLTDDIVEEAKRSLADYYSQEDQ
ncbi:MAG: hypothetical protein IK106_08305 [Clostridiales bacterium]|nr:hypothetical protein [Clostridiales bacterium]MBR6254423.1 hypothetical protein [Clostridiales bacterium]